MPYNLRMQLVFTSVYLRKAKKLLTEVERRAAEQEIARDPFRWPVIPGTGGLRKARAGRGTSGKSGGVRIIYYVWVTDEILYLLTVYGKSQKTDLTAADKKALRKIVDSLRSTD